MSLNEKILIKDVIYKIQFSKRAIQGEIYKNAGFYVWFNYCVESKEPYRLKNSPFFRFSAKIRKSTPFPLLSLIKRFSVKVN